MNRRLLCSHYDDKFNNALRKNTRKNYKWSGIGLLDQLRYNKKNMLS